MNLKNHSTGQKKVDTNEYIRCDFIDTKIQKTRANPWCYKTDQSGTEGIAKEARKPFCGDVNILYLISMVVYGYVHLLKFYLIVYFKSILFIPL